MARIAMPGGSVSVDGLAKEVSGKASPIKLVAEAVAGIKIDIVIWINKISRFMSLCLHTRKKLCKHELDIF